jgi:hypothetical protein
MDTPATDKTKRIRELNDAFRKSFCGGQVTVTAGVHALPSAVKARVLEAVRKQNGTLRGAADISQFQSMGCGGERLGAERLDGLRTSSSF